MGSDLQLTSWSSVLRQGASFSLTDGISLSEMSTAAVSLEVVQVSGQDAS